MSLCARRSSRSSDRVVVAPVDELHVGAVTRDRLDACRRAVGRKKHDASASESLGKRCDRAPVIAVARGAQRRRTQTLHERAEIGEGDERSRWIFGCPHALVKCPRATESFERRKSQPLLLVLDGDSGNAASRGQTREIDDRGHRVFRHRAMKSAGADPDLAIPAVPRVAVNVEDQTLAGHDGMLGARVTWEP